MVGSGWLGFLFFGSAFESESDWKLCTLGYLMPQRFGFQTLEKHWSSQRLGSDMGPPSWLTCGTKGLYLEIYFYEIWEATPFDLFQTVDCIKIIRTGSLKEYSFFLAFTTGFCMLYVIIMVLTTRYVRLRERNQSHGLHLKNVKIQGYMYRCVQ